MGFDEDASQFVDELAEMNRPKSADYFTWAYPDNSAMGTPPESVKLENGVISMEYILKANYMVVAKQKLVQEQEKV